MPIPSGTGTEVLKNSLVMGQGGTEVDLIDLTVSGIWTATIISVVVTNDHGSEDGFFDLHIVSPSSPAGSVKLVVAQSATRNETFVFNDRVVLTDGQKLAFLRNGSQGSWDITTSYILQDWT